MNEIVLSTNRLTKRYGHHKAVNDLNIHVRKGAIYGLIGRNGAGKTTFLKMVAGLARPTEGEIRILGYSGKNLEKIRKRVGCLIEEPGIYGNLSAYENLRMKCKFCGMDRKSYIEEILKTVGLAETGKKKAKHFSLGMKQRLGIGLALAGEPDLLLLDEPINGLDPQGIAEVRDTILKLNEERNMTIVISSHILEELSKIATDYGIIHQGSLLEEISREALLQKCTERMEICSDCPERIVPVLERMGYTKFQVADKEHIYIYERLDESAKLNEKIVQEGIPLKELRISNKKLENYYLDLTGGGQHD